MSTQEPAPNKAVWLQDIDERCRNMAAITRQRESAQVIQLPLWHEGQRGTPNSFLRSALFAAIQGKDRVYLESAILFSQKGNSVKFTGKQLNQEDMTIWLALVDLGRQQPLGNECIFTAYSILKHIGLKDGGEQRKVLHNSILRLTACVVEISYDKKIYGGSLIYEFIIDEDTKHYKISLNINLINLFGESDWTAINWTQRKQLKAKPLASKLHEYYSSHECPKSVRIEFLYNITGSRNSQAASFKRQVKNALDALIKIGFLESYNIEDDLVTVKRVHMATRKTSKRLAEKMA
jgi:TrfA protein